MDSAASATASAKARKDEISAADVWNAELRPLPLVSFEELRKTKGNQIQQRSHGTHRSHSRFFKRIAVNNNGASISKSLKESLMSKAALNFAALISTRACPYVVTLPSLLRYHGLQNPSNTYTNQQAFFSTHQMRFSCVGVPK